MQVNSVPPGAGIEMAVN